MKARAGVSLKVTRAARKVINARRNTCDRCGLPHHVMRQVDDAWVCAPCDYLEMVHSDRLQLDTAIRYLRARALCAYCGEPASDVEHVVPRSSNLPTFTVPACKECNSIAGSRVFGCFEEKRDYIQWRLRRRHEKALRMPEWDNEELAELGAGLKKFVSSGQARRNALKQRLEWNWLAAVLGEGA